MALPNIYANALKFVGNSYDYIMPGEGTSRLTDLGTTANINDPGIIALPSTEEAQASRDAFLASGGQLTGSTPPPPADTTTGGDTGTSGGGSSFDRTGTMNTINERAKAADKVFKTLFDGIDRVLNEQTGFLSGQQATVQQGLEDSRQQESRTTRNQFAARGLSDSSYRARAVGDINREAQRLASGERQAYQGQLAGLSREANVARLGAEQQQTGIQRQLAEMANYTDQELVALKNDLDKIINQRQLDVAQTTTNPAELAGFDAETRLPGLTQRIEAIAQSAFAPQVKEQLISGLITNSGLNEDEQQILTNRFLSA